MPSSGNNVNWPDPDEYDWALQNRSTTFYDPDIQRGNLMMRANRPARLNGGGSKYVCVFKVDNWIVRCFAAQPPNIAPPTDIQLRYRTIASYLNRPNYAHDFSYLAKPIWFERGLNVKGEDLPFVKVPYINNSRPLGDFLIDHSSDQPVINKLAQQWFDITQRMELHNVAHGDLDMSNVLVCGSPPNISLKLIDFDGMYVPDLARYRLGVADSGHAHFQPTKTGIRKFGPELDRFSVLVIYITLIALTRNPALWENCDADETRPLLGAEDFARLGLSQNFIRLNQERDNSELQQCLQELQNSIMQNRMPHSLPEILRRTDSGFYVIKDPTADLPSSSLPNYDGRNVVIPLGPEHKQANYNPPSTPPPPPPPYTPSPSTIPSTRRSKKRWIIAAVLIVIIIALIIWWSATRQHAQVSPLPLAQAILLFTPTRKKRFSAVEQAQEGPTDG